MFCCKNDQSQNRVLQTLFIFQNKMKKPIMRMKMMSKIQVALKDSTKFQN